MNNNLSDMQQKSPDQNNAHWEDLNHLLKFSFFLGINIAIITIYITYISNAQTWTRRYSTLFIVLGLTLLIIIAVRLLRMSKAFLFELHNLESPQNLNRIILQRLFGVPVPPFLRVKYPRLRADKGHLNHPNHWVTWLGGPVELIVMDNSAVYLERGNRFSRVAGSGKIFVHRNEIVRHVLDLRPQNKSGIISAWTKDGIRVDVELQLTYQIRLGKSMSPTDLRDFPVDPIATKQAVEATAVRNDKDHGLVEFNWLDGAWGRTVGILTKYISSYKIDKLLRGDSKKDKTISSFVEKNLLTELNRELEKIGVSAKDPKILSTKYPELVKNILEKVWAAERKGVSIIEGGISKANQLQTQLETKLETQRVLIKAISDGLENMSDEQFAQHFSLLVTSELGLSSDNSTMQVQMTELILEYLAQFKDLTQFDID